MRVAFYLEPGTLDSLFAGKLSQRVQHQERFNTAASLFRGLKSEYWDLVVVGWRLADIDGHDLLRWANAMLSILPPIVFMSAHTNEDDIASVPEAGALDYIFAPVSESVLRARINALLRLFEERSSREPDGQASACMQFGQYVLHRRYQYVDVRGERIMLRPKEHLLALLFFENIGKPLTRGYLQKTIWGTSEIVSSRSLDAHISRLRSKLRLVKDGGFEIRQVYKVGYRLDLVDR